jgi:hypothetical protein
MEPHNGIEAAGNPGSELDISSVCGRESPHDRELQPESGSSFVSLPEAVERATSLALAQPVALVDDV